MSMGSHPDPLPDDLLPLLDAERSVRPVAAAARARIAAGLGAVLAGPRSPGSRHESPDGDGTGGAAPAAVGGAGASRALLLRGLAVGFVLGGGMGAATVYTAFGGVPPAPAVESRHLQDRGSPGVHAARPAGAGAAGAPATPARRAVDAGPGDGAGVPGAPGYRPHVRAAGERPSGRDVASREADDAAFVRERRMMDAARASLAHRNGSDALGLVEQHERQFPRGAFVEEREALRIRVLALLSRRPEAVKRARSFRAAYPESLFWPSIRAALGPGGAGDPPAGP